MMQRISQLDWPHIICSRRATILLGVAAALSVPGIIILHSEMDFDALTLLQRAAVSVAGAAAALGMIALIAAMGLFWLRCDDSSQLSRNIWFGLLLFGFAYGTTVAYYAIVYLPAVATRLRNPRAEVPVKKPVSLPRGLGKPHERFGPFRKVLLIIWAIIAVPLVLSLALPGKLAPYAGWTMLPFFLSSALVVVESLVFVLIVLYFSGMSRPPRSDADHASNRPTPES